MAAPSVTYSFSNSTTADATQVNQNFTDIINGLSDGTKDLTINALTCAGAVSFQGNVTLGNGTPDDITISGSIAASIPVKTTFSYDLGSSTIGWKSFYLGSNDSAARTVRVIAGAVGSSYTLTLPTGAGSAGQSVRNLGSGSLAFLSDTPGKIINLGLSAAVGSSALTMSVKGADGNDPSATNPVYVTFRNATSATGTPVTRSITGALSTVISSTSTAGFTSAKTHYLNWYLIDNAGTVELAWSGTWFDSGTIVSTTAEGGAGAADSGTTMYSTTARSNVACVFIGRTKHSLTTAGTWDEVPDEISLAPCDLSGFRSRVRVSAGNTHGSTNTRVRKFTTTDESVGSDITYATTAADGASFTINKDGDYFISYSDFSGSAGSVHGISLNSSQLTTNIQSITSADALAYVATPANTTGTACWAGRLRVNDVIRAHTNATPDATDGYCRFTISRVG